MKLQWELEDRISKLEAKCDRLRDVLVEIREIYAGMDGFIHETCPEGYQQRIIKQMYSAAVDGLKKAEE
jgi:hypothetical protein